MSLIPIRAKIYMIKSISKSQMPLSFKFIGRVAVSEFKFDER